jgi:hypothetical protein
LKEKAEHLEGKVDLIESRESERENRESGRQSIFDRK